MRRKILDGENITKEIDRLIKDATTDLTLDSSRVNKNFKEEFQNVFNLDDDLVESIVFLRKPNERQRLAELAVREAYEKKEAEITPEIMRKIEREVYLKVLDTLWMQHLENMQHLREGIGWRSVGQRDPLVEYRAESQKLFDGLQKNLREEVLRILLTVTLSEATENQIADGEEYDSELTKMAESSTEKGVNEISAGDKNLDDEFKPSKKKPKLPGSKGSSKKTSKKSKKSARKKGRR